MLELNSYSLERERLSGWVRLTYNTNRFLTFMFCLRESQEQLVECYLKLWSVIPHFSICSSFWYLVHTLCWAHWISLPAPTHWIIAIMSNLFLMLMFDECLSSKKQLYYDGLLNLHHSSLFSLMWLQNIPCCIL